MARVALGRDTGANVNNPAVKVDCFPVTIEDGAIVVDMGSPAS